MGRHGSFASSRATRRRMQAQPRRDTAPEIALRRELHHRGLRYFVHSRPLPDLRRTVDVVFSRLRIAVEVRGCFWHGCRRHGVVPKANAAWWLAKFARTTARDAETARRLRSAGWILVVVWEHQLRQGATAAAERVLRAVETRRAASPKRTLGPKSRPNRHETSDRR